MGRLRLDVGFRREAHVADTVRTPNFTDVIDRIEIVRGTDILDDVERRTDRDKLGGMLHGIGERADFAAVGHIDDEARAGPPLVFDRRALCSQGLANASRCDLVARIDQETQAQTAIVVFIKSKTRRVRPAVLTAVQHVHEGTPQPVALIWCLEKHPGYAAHYLVSCPYCLEKHQKWPQMEPVGRRSSVDQPPQGNSGRDGRSM